jgi:regulator of protease activity HflC (stomatin/prohibitin superfamily)
MKNNQNATSIHEKNMFVISGMAGLFIELTLLSLSGILLFLNGIGIFFGGLTLLISFIMTAGFFILHPNEVIISTFFRTYSGSYKENGFYWTNPFYSKDKISLKISNYNSSILKVNDKRGNPIEISVVISWFVQETAFAKFAVEDYVKFLINQSESAIREVTTSYSYDHIEDESSEMTLRGNMSDIAQKLKESIQSHVTSAGIVIVEAKIVHLAYAPEIAQSMLRRQQAEAVVAARKTIVEGAVTMTENALKQLKDKASPSESVVIF